MNFKSLIAPLLTMAAPILGSVIAGKGVKYQGIAQVAVKSAVTKIDGGIDKLVAAFDKFESGNEVVQEATTEFLALAKQAGFVLPTVDVVQAHLKAAIYDLATAIAPNAGLVSPATTLTSPTTAS